MSATATAEPIARKGAMGRIDFIDSTPDIGARPTKTPDTLTDEERARLLAESKNYEDLKAKAIAYGKLTGDFTIDRHIWSKRTGAEIDAEILRIQAEHPERFTGKPVRWTGD